MVKLVTLFAPEQLVNLGTKTLGQKKNVIQQHEYTEHVALVLLGEWVSPRHIPAWDSVVSGEQVQ